MKILPVVSLLVLVAAPVAAQPTPYKAPAPGSVYPAPAALPASQYRAAAEFAHGLKDYPAPPEKYPAPTDLDSFARSASQMRRDLDTAAIVLAALQSEEFKKSGTIGEGDRERLVKKMTDTINNRNAWLDKMQTAFMDTLPKPAPLGQPKYEGPSIGLPSRPTRAAYVPRSAAGIIAEKGFPGGPGAQLHPVTKAISQGWTAGAWVGNEVMIKEELRQSWKAQDDLRKAQADWDKNVKPQWEANERQRREDRRRADERAAAMAPTYRMIFDSIFMPRPFIVKEPPKTPPPSTTPTSSLPKIPPTFGTGYGYTGGYGPLGGNGPYGGGMGMGGYGGYNGNRYGSSMGGNGPYGGTGGMGGYGSAGYAGGAGMGGALGR